MKNRKDAILNMHQVLLKRRDALRKALAGDLSMLKELSDQTGGDVVAQCGIGTAATMYAGTLKIHGSGTITLLWIKGGTCEPNSTGTITNLYVTGGTADFTKSAAARTVTTAKLDPSGIIKYDPSIVTMTNKIQPYSTSGVITMKAA